MPLATQGINEIPEQQETAEPAVPADHMETRLLRRHILLLEAEILRLQCDLLRERHLANIDILTGIPNRRAYQKRLQEERARCRRTRKRLSMVVCDIDRFKSINDNHGHRTGDHVLTLVAQKISRRLRKTDFVARCGGEEFVVLLSDCGTESARQLAEKIREEIAESGIETEQGAIGVTVSCGVAEFIPSENDIALFARADAALYRAKTGGRNRVCVADAKIK